MEVLEFDLPSMDRQDTYDVSDVVTPYDVVQTTDNEPIHSTSLEDKVRILGYTCVRKDGCVMPDTCAKTNMCQWS